MPGINGWYYDTQLDNKLTSVTLHSNKWYDENLDNGEYRDGTRKKAGGFKNWNQIEGDNGFGPNGNATDEDKFATNAGADDTDKGSGYGVDPICRSILAEDFNVTISNTWSDFGGDPVQDLWNGARVKYAPYLKNAFESINLLYENNEKSMQEGGHGKAAGFMMNLISKIGGAINNFSDKHDINVIRFLNKALISQGTRFSYYGGTGISFGNLGMKFTLFPKWDKDGNFVTVTEQVSKLYPYFIGRLDKFNEVDSLLGDLTGEQNTVYKMLQKCFMWQSPPNDYKAEIFDIDQTQEGTLKLKLGCQYELANLLCSDVMLNFSKSMVKNPLDNSVSPLFCDMALNLRPSTKFTDASLRKFVSGLTNSGQMKDDLKNLNAKLYSNLMSQKVKYDLNNGYLNFKP